MRIKIASTTSSRVESEAHLERDWLMQSFIPFSLRLSIVAYLECFEPASVGSLADIVVSVLRRNVKCSATCGDECCRMDAIGCTCGVFGARHSRTVCDSKTGEKEAQRQGFRLVLPVLVPFWTVLFKELERTQAFLTRVFSEKAASGSLLVVVAAERCQCMHRALRWWLYITKFIYAEIYLFIHLFIYSYREYMTHTRKTKEEKEISSASSRSQNSY